MGIGTSRRRVEEVTTVRKEEGAVVHLRIAVPFKFVTGVDEPPLAEMRTIGRPKPGPKRMMPSLFHVPPSGRFASTSASVRTGPPPASTRFNLSPAKNPMDLPSPDQKGRRAPSVPARGLTLSPSIDRNQNCHGASEPPAAKTTAPPSGATATCRHPVGVPYRSVAGSRTEPSALTASRAARAKQRRRLPRRGRPPRMTTRSALATVIACPRSASRRRAPQTIRPTRGAHRECPRAAFGFFSRHRRRRRRTLAGVAAGNAVWSGSARNTAANVSETSSPSNARRPVSISNSTQPKAQRNRYAHRRHVHAPARGSCTPPCRARRQSVSSRAT